MREHFTRGRSMYSSRQGGEATTHLRTSNPAFDWLAGWLAALAGSICSALTIWQEAGPSIPLAGWHFIFIQRECNFLESCLRLAWLGLACPVDTSIANQGPGNE